LLETERLVLRKPRLDDVDSVLEYSSDPVAMEFIGEASDDPADAQTAIERWLARWEADGLGFFAVDRRADGVMVGRIGLLVWDTGTWETSTLAESGDRGQVELGWSLAQAHWGHGYATEAARAARAWAYAQGITSLISLIHPDNARSIRVAEKLEAVPTDTVAVKGKPAVIWRHPHGQLPAR
jgi:RimJ/RimL family protein N-acetyltransferase